MVLQVRAVEPERALWVGDDAEVVERTGLRALAERLVDHHRTMVSLFREMYRDVAYGLSDVPRDLSFFRSKPYLERIEKEMQGLVEWVAPSQQAAKAGPTKGFTKGGGGGKKKAASSKGFGGR